MKKTIVFIAALIMLTCAYASAQVHLNVSVNIGQQPVWGPVGYDYAEYYYLPDIETYYYVPQHVFIYKVRGHWRRSASLPTRYRDYDLYHSYKVVLNEPTPYRYHDRYRTQYETYRGHHDQEVIRDSRDSKYFVIKGHPHHNEWKEQSRKHGRGRKG